MLSKSWNKRKKDYDFVVVGSGYGGAITAARIASARLQPPPSLCILERGREWPVGKFPDTFGGVVGEFRNRAHPLGLYEILRYSDVTVLKGCGLGGTSLINANVAAIPDPEVFELPEWPRSLTLETLRPYMERAKRTLGAQPDPRAWSFKKVQAMDRRAREMGKRAEPMDLTINQAPWHFNRQGVFQRPCLGCGDCATGCNHHSKNTLYMNYLPMARNAGADIFTGKRVKWIEKLPDGGWRVHGTLYEGGLLDSDFRLDAANVILAAGSVHSTEILLRSQLHGLSLSPAVGTGFSCNGDFFGMSYNGDFQTHVIGFGNHRDSPVAENPPGPAIVSGIHYNSHLPLKQRLHVEDHSIPRAYVQAAKKAFAALPGEDSDSGDEAEEKRRVRRDMAALRRYQPDGALNHTMVYMVMSFDDARGKLILNEPNGEVKIVWDEAGRQPVYTRLNEELRRHARAEGGSFISNPLWHLFDMRHLMTAHPLGGCPLAEDWSQGAVDEFGRVFSGSGEIHDGLLVADGAIVPTSVGINPFVTISALAERIAERKIHALQGDAYPARQPTLSVSALPELGEAEECDLERVFRRRPGRGPDTLAGSGVVEFDEAGRVIGDGARWQGFLSKDHPLTPMSAPIFKGFSREFRREGGKWVGVTSNLDGDLKVRHETEEIRVEARTRELEPGRYLLLRHLDAPWEGFYEILKAIDDHLLVGRAYAGNYPDGTRLHTYAMSRRYDFDQMTPGDHQALCETGAAPTPEELKGSWRMDLISVAGRAAGLGYLKFDVDSESRLAAGGWQPAGLLEGLLFPESFADRLQHPDFASGKIHLRRLNDDRMVGGCVLELDETRAETLHALGFVHHPLRGESSCLFSLTRVSAREYPGRTVLTPYLSVQLPDGLQLSLREELAGWFLPGEISPAMEAADGRPAEGVDCRLQLRLTVGDLNEFIDGPAHLARVGGSLVLAEFEGKKDRVFEIDERHSSFQYQQLDQRSHEAQVRYRLRLVSGSERGLLIEGFKSLRKEETAGAAGWLKMSQDFTTFYGCLKEASPQDSEIGAIYLKSKTAAEMALPGSLHEVLSSWTVAGTDDPLLRLQAKMRLLAYTGQFSRLEWDPAL